MSKSTDRDIKRAATYFMEGETAIGARVLAVAHRCANRQDQRRIESEISAYGVWHEFRKDARTGSLLACVEVQS